VTGDFVAAPHITARPPFMQRVLNPKTPISKPPFFFKLSPQPRLHSDIFNQTPDRESGTTITPHINIGANPEPPSWHVVTLVYFPIEENGDARLNFIHLQSGLLAEPVPGARVGDEIGGWTCFQDHFTLRGSSRRLPV